MKRDPFGQSDKSMSKDQAGEKMAWTGNSVWPFLPDTLMPSKQNSQLHTCSQWDNDLFSRDPQGKLKKLKKKVSKAGATEVFFYYILWQEARLPHPVLSTVRFKQPWDSNNCWVQRPGLDDFPTTSKLIPIFLMGKQSLSEIGPLVSLLNLLLPSRSHISQPGAHVPPSGEKELFGPAGQQVQRLSQVHLGALYAPRAWAEVPELVDSRPTLYKIVGG